MALLLEWEWQRGKPAAPGSPAKWVRIWCARSARQLHSVFGVNEFWQRGNGPSSPGVCLLCSALPCLCPGAAEAGGHGRGSRAGLLMEQAASGGKGSRSSPGQLPEGWFLPQYVIDWFNVQWFSD